MIANLANWRLNDTLLICPLIIGGMLVVACHGGSSTGKSVHSITPPATDSSGSNTLTNPSQPQNQQSSRSIDSRAMSASQAADASPAAAGVHYERGMSFLHQGKASEAIAELKTAIKQEPSNRLFRTALGAAYLADNQLELAITEVDQVNRDFPQIRDAVLVRGMATEARGDWQSAWSAYAHAARLSPQDGRADFQLFLLAARFGKPLREGINGCEKAAAINSKFAGCMQYLGPMRERFARHNKALQDLIAQSNRGRVESPSNEPIGPFAKLFIVGALIGLGSAVATGEADDAPNRQAIESQLRRDEEYMNNMKREQERMHELTSLMGLKCLFC